MRPLPLHASPACALPKFGDLIHLEFAATELPHALDWNDRVFRQGFGSPSPGTGKRIIGRFRIHGIGIW
jgi:hypothetical protein